MVVVACLSTARRREIEIIFFQSVSKLGSDMKNIKKTLLIFLISLGK